MDIELKNLAQRIKNRRDAQRMTMKQLGELIGVSHVTISKWESGLSEPKGHNLSKLAQVLNVSSDYLLKGSLKASSSSSNDLYNKFCAMINDAESSQKNAIYINVEGNSMLPVLPEGTIVGVDASQTEISDGKLYAVEIDGLIRIRLAYKRSKSSVRIKCFNTQEYDDEFYDHEHIRVLGRVFWYSVLI